ncbi:phenylacetaldoxime dehydratase family protein [Robbsia sp. Bb-Pol-6]|uniref:Phenylacetaldoxime dehydratase family protein n=1 Tax=Robbsia betulipollinis TaxID=2981849 RepID=A0ABT3ZKC0_9BURK|nr:phenylacetaldoxime dehydratase family protein [Robbsia betulipollinis]MCY0386991.1 phenylacetaldoxime dehydratase family protein [Robbsia betulipollinis]
MESAIPRHLQCPRTLQRRVDDGYTPPFPAWTARPSRPGQTIVMALLGVQACGAHAERDACAGLRQIVAGLHAHGAPLHCDVAHQVDECGYVTMIAITYWRDVAAYDAWAGRPDIDAWWRAPARLTDGVGWFREVLAPAEQRYETLFSAPDRLEAGGAALGRLSQEIMEHGYWGSMRDRLPLSQTDPLSASGALTIIDGAPGPGARVRVAGHANLAVIRSGQDWSDTAGEERRLYCDNIAPVLRAGMDFLRDAGTSVGCYANRYMQQRDVAGRPVEKTFGLSYWHSLTELERWAESHATHVAIFGTFMQVVQELNFALRLRLYHEVAVLTSGQQRYEYVNCHARSGILNGLPRES